MGTFLIPFRETLEAAIIIGLILSLLKVSGGLHIGRKYIFSGVIVGIICSGLFAWGFHVLFSGFEGRVEKIYEGVLMILAFGLITQFIIWNNHNFKNIGINAKKNITKALQTGELWILFMITFFVVVREGVETVIFLNALQVTSDTSSIFLGILGVLLAIFVSWLLFLSIKKINIKKVLKYSNIMFIFIAAGLLAHSIVEFQGANLLPTFIKPVFDLSPILSEQHGLGSFLKAILGYDANPSLLALLAYFGYLTAMFNWLGKKK